MSDTFEQEDDRIPGRRVGSVLAVALVVTTAAVIVPGWIALVAPIPPVPATSPSGILERGTVEEARGLALQRAQRSELEAPACVDSSRGLVRVPIERAMQSVAEARR